MVTKIFLTKISLSKKIFIPNITSLISGKRISIKHPHPESVLNIHIARANVYFRQRFSPINSVCFHHTSLLYNLLISSSPFTPSGKLKSFFLNRWKKNIVNVN